MFEHVIVKEIKLDNKVICKYYVDESNVLYINVTHRYFLKNGQEIKDLEKYYQKIIQILENRKFHGLAYLNI